MGRVVDLDAARAARAEAKGEAPCIRFGGQDWTLPVEMPWEVAEVASEGTAAAAMSAVRLLVGEQWVEFKKHQPSLADVMVLIEAIAEIYGADPGKS